MTVSVFLVIQDGKNDPTTREFEFPDATPVGVLAAAVPVIAGLVNPLVTGGLRAAGFKVQVDVPLWGPTAILTSDIQEMAEFGVRTVNGFLKKFSLPTFDEAFFVAGTKEVDRSDPDMVAFIDFIEEGITVSSTLIQPTDSRGEDLDELVTAREAWGKARR